MRRARIRPARAGFTIVELLLAVGLLSILVVAVLELLDTSLDVWQRTETERDRREVAASVLDLLARDLGTLEPGPRGDLVGDWVPRDGDGDGTPGVPMQRVRLVRRPSPADLQRAGAPEGSDLLEAAWVLLPDVAADGPARSIGVLWRGERAVGDPATASFLETRSFEGAAGRTSLALVTGGVLWMRVSFATQTSILTGGWRYGESLDACATSWDAWGAGRPDTTATSLNLPGAGMPAADPELPLMPRRVRIELELERPADVARRPRLAAPVESRDATLRVTAPDRMPAAGAMILVGDEWMELSGVSGSSASVVRGRRGTLAQPHPAGSVVHHGARVEREVVVPVHREDWNL